VLVVQFKTVVARFFCFATVACGGSVRGWYTRVCAVGEWEGGMSLFDSLQQSPVDPVEHWFLREREDTTHMPMHRRLLESAARLC